MGTKKNTDTVPAMLTPGEFVIKRDSAQKIGYDALEMMNETGKVPDMKKHGGKMAGYLKSKFLNGMMKGYENGGEVEGLSPSQLSQLKGVGYNELLSVPRPQMMTEEQMEMFDDEGLLGQILTYGAPMENAAVEGDPYATKQEMAYNLLTGGPDMQNQIMSDYIAKIKANPAASELFKSNEYTYDSDTDEYIYVGPGKGDESAQDAAIGDAYKYLGYQDGGAVPFQMSPNATLSRRPTQIDVQPSTLGRPIDILDIVQRTGPDATTPGPFTGASEKNMIDGLINYIMSPKYDSRTGKHKKQAEMLKKDIDTVAVFGDKSSDTAIKNILNHLVK